MARSALFLDRDGTIIVDTGYPRDPDIVRLVDGVTAALSEARSLGYALVIVSNQSGIARGIVSREQLALVHARTTELLATEGVVLDGAYYCVHGPSDDCACRKPRPGLLFDAAAQHGIELASSLLIGDKPSDVLAAEAAGCAGFQLGTWPDALAWLRTNHGRRDRNV